MKRLIALVNKVMEYEKTEREEFVLEKTSENVYDLMKFLVETHKKKLKENKQRVKIT
jgi:hypothetical protein